MALSVFFLSTEINVYSKKIEGPLEIHHADRHGFNNLLESLF